MTTKFQKQQLHTVTRVFSALIWKVTYLYFLPTETVEAQTSTSARTHGAQKTNKTNSSKPRVSTCCGQASENRRQTAHPQRISCCASIELRQATASVATGAFGTRPPGQFTGRAIKLAQANTSARAHTHTARKAKMRASTHASATCFRAAAGDRSTDTTARAAASAKTRWAPHVRFSSWKLATQASSTAIPVAIVFV